MKIIIKAGMFDGEPASQESIDFILSALEISMEMAKQKNKVKPLRRFNKI